MSPSGSTNHDAAPAARVRSDSDRPDNPATRPATGTGETHYPSGLGCIPGRQSPARERMEERPLDDTRPDTKGEATGGRGPDTPEAHGGLRNGSLDGCETVHEPQTCPYVRGRTTQHCSLNFTLTDGERMAVAYFAEFGQWPAGKRHADTLRALLERLG